MVRATNPFNLGIGGTPGAPTSTNFPLQRLERANHPQQSGTYRDALLPNLPSGIPGISSAIPDQGSRNVPFADSANFPSLSQRPPVVTGNQMMADPVGSVNACLTFLRPFAYSETAQPSTTTREDSSQPVTLEGPPKRPTQFSSQPENVPPPPTPGPFVPFSFSPVHWSAFFGNMITSLLCTFFPNLTFFLDLRQTIEQAILPVMHLLHL